MAGLNRAENMTRDEVRQLRELLARWIRATTWSTWMAEAVLADIDEDFAEMPVNS